MKYLTFVLLSALILGNMTSFSIHPVFADTKSTQISNSSNDSIDSTIAIDGSNIYLAWDERSGPISSEIFFSKSTDGGETFSAPQNLSNNEGFSDSQSIAVDGSNVFVAWSDKYMDNTAIFLIKSTDGGQTFSAPQIISSSTGFSSSQSIETDGTSIFNTWNWAERSV